MGKKNRTYVILVVFTVLVVAAVLLLQNRPTADSGIVLPQGSSEGANPGGESTGGQLNVVQITPDTVQPAINTLSRPMTYQRTETVELFYDGGSGRSVSQVAVSGKLTRIDSAMLDGSVLHMLVSGDTAAVWYDEETAWTILRTEAFSGDVARRMLTYETVRDLQVSEIDQAEYRDVDGVRCICVMTAPDADGYADLYCVSVSSGLLFRAERYENGVLIYRFAAEEPSGEPPADDRFLLPDGSALLLGS